MDMNQYLSMFIDESNDHLQSLNENMLQLEGNPEDLGIVQVIFRSAHTLKGMAATMGFEDLASLTHKMENVLDLVRNEKLKMQDYIFDTMFKSLDALETMVQDITEGGQGKADVSSIVASLQAIENGEMTSGAAPATEKTNRLTPQLLRQWNWMNSSIQCWISRLLKATVCFMWMYLSASIAS